MRPMRYIHAIIVTLSMSPMLLPLAAAESLTLTATEWPPYVAAGVQRNGFAMALVGRALERAGYEVSASVESWPAALDATVAGERDVFASLWYSDERAELLVFSEPYISNEITFIRLSSSGLHVRDRADLDGLRIGVVDDFAYSRETFDTAGINVQASGSVAENVARLREGELDLVVADRRAALHEINERALATLFDVLPEPVVTRGLRIAVSRQRDDAAEIVAAFEAEIGKMREDGSFNAILATFRVSN